jgi:cbb3-type cytochrome oxidase maturation protein
MSFFVLIPLSIAMGLVGLGAFLWALRNNQFDDPQGAASRVLILETHPQQQGETDGKLASQPGYPNPQRGI